MLRYPGDARHHMPWHEVTLRVLVSPGFEGHARACDRTAGIGTLEELWEYPPQLFQVSDLVLRGFDIRSRSCILDEMSSRPASLLRVVAIQVRIIWAPHVLSV